MKELDAKILDLEGSVVVRGIHIKYLEKENAALIAKLAAIEQLVDVINEDYRSCQPPFWLGELNEVLKNGKVQTTERKH